MAASVARGVGLGSPLSESDWWCDRATDAGVVACRAVLAHQVRRGVDRHIGDAWPSPRSTRGGEAGEGRSRRRGAGGDLGVRQQGTAGLNPALGQRVETGRLGRPVPSNQSGQSRAPNRPDANASGVWRQSYISMLLQAPSSLLPNQAGVAVGRERSRRPSE